MGPSQMTQVLHPYKFPKHPTLVQLRVCVQDPQLPEVSTDQHDEMATDGCVAGSHSVSDPKTARRLEIQGQTVDAFPSEVQYYLRLGLEKEAVRLGSGDWANPFSNCAPFTRIKEGKRKLHGPYYRIVWRSHRRLHPQKILTMRLWVEGD